jgi:hypothetical protein
MLTIVFGAGASYDSSLDYSQSEERATLMEGRVIILRGMRPPLANQLFELRATFATASQEISKSQLILDQLRRRSSDVSVEQKLEKLREESVNYPEGKRQLVSIQFYLQMIIGECQSQWNQSIHAHTTYKSLLGQIDKQLKGEPACLVTFNYDTLLEEAFISLGKRFESLNDYTSQNDYKIIKPHGSVNWVRELTSPLEIHQSNHLQLANDLIARADTLQASDRYHQIPDSDRVHDGRWIVSYIQIPDKPGPQAVLPAVAIPLVKKNQFVCPAEHMKALEECISKTDKLLIIGWKAQEKNFVGLLSKGLKKGIPKMIVSSSRDSAARIKNMLQRFGVGGASWNFGENGFTDSVQSGRIESFISK